MIYPIVVYGHPILRKVAAEINKDYPDLNQLIADLFETMYYSEGLGLAAPQIGKSIRIFVIDGKPAAEDDPSLADFKRAFINPHITERSGETLPMTEGCLSIPNVYIDVKRPEVVEVAYKDENGRPRTLKASDLLGRCIQHEMDHLNGVLFVDRVENSLTLNEELSKHGFSYQAVKPVL